MTPAARLQAAIEIVDGIVAAAQAGGAAADTLIQRYFRDRRYAGSRDRRAVRDLVYAAIRRAGEPPASGRAALIGLAADQPELGTLFDGSTHAPAPIAPDERGAPAGIVPAWLEDRLAATLSAGEIAALLDRAPLDCRANRLKVTRDALIAALPEAVPGRLATDAFCLPEGSVVDRSPAWQQGWFEVQDEGSQLIVEACDAAPGQTVIDLCAGAGGKTLGLAATMANKGRLVACDVDRARLSRLRPRAERAGATIVEERLLDGNREAAAVADLRGQADVVLVDAPCSGSGTWRRNPEARWRLTPARLDRLTALQAQVLGVAAPLVRPGGTLVYAVCSLLDAEGADRIAAFTSGDAGWDIEALQFGRSRGGGRLLTPARDGTDGFFVARLRRAC